jgi:hypothetical protein
MSGYAQWNPATIYVINDIVSLDGVLYISLLGSNINRPPNSNPTYWATTGASATITSVVAGSGIGVAGTTAITVSNTGVRTLTASTNMTVGGTATDPTVENNGVRSTTAGTNITVGGTANIPIINALPTIVRVSSVITSLYQNNVSPIQLNNFVSTNPTTAIAITLPPAFTGCNSFTFYIRSIEITSQSTYSGAGNVFFNVYLSQSLDTARNDNDGATIAQFFSVLPSLRITRAFNVVWNWAPTGGLTSNTFYFNLTSTTPTSPTSTTTITRLQIIYDVEGHFNTLT